MHLLETFLEYALEYALPQLILFVCMCTSFRGIRDFIKLGTGLF